MDQAKSSPLSSSQLAFPSRFPSFQHSWSTTFTSLRPEITETFDQFLHALSICLGFWRRCSQCGGKRAGRNEWRRWLGNECAVTRYEASCMAVESLNRSQLWEQGHHLSCCWLCYVFSIGRQYLNVTPTSPTRRLSFRRVPAG